MIEITIKTLDSRNHSFSVGDELTVKQLKEHIAEPVNVPAESQRLIYCGRVLVDEKKLSEYDVNGKVIHLVQRAPPSSSNDSGGNSGNDFRSTSRRQFRLVQNQNVRVDGGSGNAMYLGAMAFPADLMDAQGITMPQPRHGLSQSRLSVVRTMLRRGRYVLQNLENPNIQESPAEYNGNNIDPLALVAQAAAAAAFAASVTRNTSGQTAPPNPPIISIEADASAGVASEVGSVPEETRASSAEEANEIPTSANDGAADGAAQSAQAAEEPQQGSRSGENGRNGRRYPGTTALADLISMVQDINTRLQPFLERYYVLMRDDPVLENPAEEQRFFNQVSELMHFMSHAYHAISDVMCDFSQPPPRLLRCRPVLIQHSAVLQTGIPIQLNLNSNSQTRGTGTNTGESNENRGATAEQETRGEPEANSEERRNVSNEGSGQTEETEEIPQHARTAPLTSAEQGQGPPQLSGRSVSLGPSNFEFFMDVGQGSITIDSVEATVVTGGASADSENASANLPTGPTSESRDNRTSQSPPDFIQNFMQALAGHMTQALDATNAREDRANSAASHGGGPASQMSSPAAAQGHLNTSTQPTTSTQTRSTTRPHVHIAPALQGMGMPGFFDPFLPCNSHHIRSARRRTQAQSEQTESQQQHQQSAPQPFQQQQPADATNTTSQDLNGSSTVPGRVSGPPTSPPPPFPPVVTAVGSDVASLFGNIQRAGLRTGNQQDDAQRLDGATRTVRWNPNDVTFLFQAHPLQHNFLLHYPNSAGASGPVTLEEIMLNSPDFNYTEGVSLVTDFFVLLARNVRLLDAIGGETRMIMFNMRSAVAQFITSRLLSSGQDTSNITEAVNRINAELRNILESMSGEVTMREDVDFIATLSQLNHTTIPNLIRTVLEQDEGEYWRNITIQLSQYARRLAAILLYCCHNGHDDFERLFLAFARRVIEGAPTLQSWAATRLARLFRSLSSTTDSAECVHHLLVYRMGEGPATLLPALQPPVQPPVVVPATPAAPQPQAQPMEVEEPPPVPEQIADPLPDVILGAEQWHNHVPPDWVPIITRDRERQRRQAVQGPLSDAYLSGMPSKRRKVVTSNKPQGNLTKVISESMSSAMGAAGMGAVDGLAESAGTDPALRAAYKEQVRTTVQTTLRTHPDYKPEKYPNAAKLFGPN
ncbi:large proline-rich protein BAG6 isoform X2 [Rhodnius prolixus]|uniref:large proline-rich protein BAG6 isoform X2 n=1 Tax=Rhodnius prolixus TaxID=13249 RepID=UPI003D18A263